MAGWALGLAAAPCCGLTSTVGIVLAIVVLARSRQGVDHGRRLAVAALVIGPIWVVLGVVAAVTGMFDLSSDASRDEAGKVAVRSEQSTMKLRSGDCFDELGEGADDTEIAETVTAVPCAQPHQFQVFHEFDLTGDSYPTPDEISRVAEDTCSAEFRPFVGITYDASELEVSWLTPSFDTWDRLGDRSVDCLVGISDELITGTLENSRR
jgi:hypothetical protein